MVLVRWDALPRELPQEEMEVAAEGTDRQYQAPALVMEIMAAIMAQT